MARRVEAAERLAGYLKRLGAAIGHADRREPLRAYVTGLLLPGERKSVEPLAARIDPRHVCARHQSMQHLVASAPWDEREVLRSARVWTGTAGAARSGRRLGGGRHGHAQEGADVGGSGAAVLRATWEARQLSGDGN
jgi:SRSO17 transposase